MAIDERSRETNQQLELDLDGRTEIQLVGYQTNNPLPYSLKNSRMFIKVVQTSADDKISHARFAIIQRHDSMLESYYRIRHLSIRNELIFERQLQLASSGNIELGRKSFDKTMDIYWQIRVTDNTIYAESGPNPDDLQPFAFDPLAIEHKTNLVENMRIQISAAESEADGETNIGEYHFDDFNIGATACPSN